MSELQVINVSKSYGQSSDEGRVVALQNLTLSIKKGEILAVLGLNGAGKTTLVKILSGLITPDTGTVRLEGMEKTSSPEYLKKIGAVFEGNRNIYWRLTAYENLQYFGVLRGLSIKRARLRAYEMLKLLKLVDKKDTTAQHLSRGMQQRLAVGISLIHDPEVIVLDEPTLGVDIENVLQIVEALKSLSRQGVTIILTSHQLDVVKMLADRIALLVGGKLAALETRSAFLARTDRGTYTLELLDKLDDSRCAKLLALGVESEEQQLWFATDLFYEVLDVLKPLRIASLNCGEEDFARIFLERVKEHEHA